MTWIVIGQGVLLAACGVRMTWLQRQLDAWRMAANHDVTLAKRREREHAIMKATGRVP